MSVKPRTIDNLGVGASSRYARDKSTLDSKLIEESRFVPQKTEVSVLKPYLPTDFEEFFEPNKLTLWASFEPPPDYLAYSRPLFSYQLIPSLGSLEKQDSDTEKLEALEEKIQTAYQGSSPEKQQEEERERKTVLHLLKTIHGLDRTLSLINSRRNQYQKG